MFLTQVWLEHTGNTLKIEIYGEYERNKTGIILFNNQMFFTFILRKKDIKQKMSVLHLEILKKKI